MLTNKVYRFDRTGAKRFVTSDQTKLALAILQASIVRETEASLVALKIRQDSDMLQLNVSERMLCSVFGEIK